VSATKRKVGEGEKINLTIQGKGKKRRREQKKEEDKARILRGREEKGESEKYK